MFKSLLKLNFKTHHKINIKINFSKLKELHAIKHQISMPT